jgi:23S rRNA-/tRNA-specific pseudouridylate synthase
VSPRPPAADEDAGDDEFDILTVRLEPGDAGVRLDKALADRTPELSRGRVQALIAQGLVSRDGVALRDASAKAAAGDYALLIPPPEPAEPLPEAIPLQVLYEDADLIVVDKPAGMAAHPAPGTPSGTLVNALMHHCGATLSGIGGVARPGIVHRLDKDTSGVLVAAKSDAAHRGLAELFARHDIDRTYVALTRGAPSPARGVIDGRIARSSHDRKKMAVVRTADAGGGDPLQGGPRLRARRATAGRPRRLPAGDRPHPSDPRAPGLPRRAGARRRRLRLRTAGAGGARGDGRGRTRPAGAARRRARLHPSVHGRDLAVREPSAGRHGGAGSSAGGVVRIPVAVLPCSPTVGSLNTRLF